LAEDHRHDHPPVSDLSRIEAIRDQAVHRTGEHEGLFSLHVVGLGKTGAGPRRPCHSQSLKGAWRPPRHSHFTDVAMGLQAHRDAYGRTVLPTEREVTSWT
jgi:hypothetical protein